MNPIQIVDIEERWRPLNEIEAVNALTLFDDAWAIITTLEPSVEDRLASGSLKASTVIAVERAMVLRVMKNPDGKFQEQIDDYSWTRDKTISGGLLYLGDDERLLLRVRRGSAFTITPSC